MTATFVPSTSGLYPFPLSAEESRWVLYGNCKNCKIRGVVVIWKCDKCNVQIEADTGEYTCWDCSRSGKYGLIFCEPCKSRVLCTSCNKKRSRKVPTATYETTDVCWICRNNITNLVEHVLTPNKTITVRDLAKLVMSYLVDTTSSLV